MTVLSWDVIAKDHASRVFANIGNEVETTEKKHHSLGKVAAVGLAAAAGAAVAFGKESVDQFQKVGGETLKLQRYIGGSAEDASRLRFTAQESGVGFDALTKGIGKFEKGLGTAELQHNRYQEATDANIEKTKKFYEEQAYAVAHGEKFTKHLRLTHPVLGAQAAAFAKMGVEMAGSDGKLRPMKELLPEVAEQIKGMSNGAEKTALVMTLFGKAGMDLVPMLNKGKDGMADLAAQSDRLGNTISAKDTAAVKENIMAKREWHATIDGLQIQLGRHLFPAITQVAQVLTRMSAFVDDNSATMKPLIAVVGGLVAGVFAITKATQAYTAVQAALNVILTANPVGLVVVAVAALAAGLVLAYKHSETFRNIVDGAFRAVRDAAALLWEGFHPIFEAIGTAFGTVGRAGQALWNNFLMPAFSAVITGWLTVVGGIVDGAAAMFGWLPGVGPKLRGAAEMFDRFKETVNLHLSAIKDKVNTDVTVSGAAAAAERANAVAGSVNAIEHSRDAAVSVSGAAAATERAAAVAGSVNAIDTARNTALSTSGSAAAASHAANVAAAVDGIDRNVHVGVATSGARAAIEDLADLRWQIDHIPRSVTVGVMNKVRGPGFNAAGTPSWRGGLTWVGERGPELVNLPRGTAIHSNADSMRMLSPGRGASGMGGDVNVTVNVSGVVGSPDQVAQALAPALRDQFATMVRSGARLGF